MKYTLVFFLPLLLSLSWACEGTLEGGSSSMSDTEGPDAAPGQFALDMTQGSGTGLDMGGGAASLEEMGLVEPAKPPSGNTITDQASLFECRGVPGSSPKRLRRVHNFEWSKNAHGTKAPFEVSRNQLYETHTDPESIDQVQLDIYLDALATTLGTWKDGDNVTEGGQGTGCFRKGAPKEVSLACTRTFVTFLLERGVLHRPATPQEVDALVAFATRELELEASQGTDRSNTIRMIVSAAWLKAAALFRSEQGEGKMDAAGRRKLGDWELAHALAFALEGRAPGSRPGKYGHSMNGWIGQTWSAGAGGHLEEVAEAARQGTLSEPATIAKLVRDNFGGTDLYRRDLELWGNHGPARTIDRRGEFWIARGILRFFQSWLGHTDLPVLFKDDPTSTSAYQGDREVSQSYWYWVTTPGYGAGYEPSYVAQMDDMIARIVSKDKDVVRSLFTSPTFYTPATKGNGTKPRGNRVYGVDTDVEAAVLHETLESAQGSGDGVWWGQRSRQEKEERIAKARAARWQTLEPAKVRRAGVLTHPAWLGAHALAFENDPNVVHRGKWIREKILCQDIPDLPITVEAAFDPETKHQSARQRMTEQVDERLFCKNLDKEGLVHDNCPEEEKTLPYCQGCHSLMNPLGYPFEIYNHAGFLRKEDHGQPPDGSATLRGMPDPDLDGPVKDAVELSQKLGDSPYVKRCFIRQSFRYFMGREETLADACTLSQMEHAYDMSEGSFSAMLIGLFQSDTFLYRSSE